MRKENQLNTDPDSRIERSTLGDRTEVREFCTLHDTEVKGGSRIYERVSLKKAEIGERVDINAGTYIEFAEIGDDVMIGPNCSIVGVTHAFGKGQPGREDIFQKITIGDRVFLGAGVIVLPGRVIGEGSVIGAGTVITKDIPPNSIVMGVPPNQIVKPLSEYKLQS